MTEPKHKLTEGDEITDVNEDTNVLVENVHDDGSVTLVVYDSLKGEPEEKVKFFDTRVTLTETEIVAGIKGGVFETEGTMSTICPNCNSDKTEVLEVNKAGSSYACLECDTEWVV